MNLGDYSAYWARLRADQPAVVCNGQTLSWRELDAQADGVAAALQALGVVKGERVGCLLNNCAEWVITYIAALKTGAMLVPLHLRYSDKQLSEIERQADCRVVVSRPDQIARLADVPPAQTASPNEICLYSRVSAEFVTLRRAADSGARPRRVETEHGDVAVISYTSGSTGLPKGVMLTHDGIFAFASSQLMAQRWTSEEQVLLLAPFAFTGGVISGLTPTYLIGACLHIEENADPLRVLAIIRERRITSLTAVPIFFERIAAAPDFAAADISCLRLAITGGAPVPEALLKQYVDKGVSIRQVYGCTEACGMIAQPSEAVALAKPWTCGWPLATLRVRTVDDHGRDVAAGERGEIWLQGEQMMRGYWRNPQADAEAWTDGWYRTGDIGVFDADGHLSIVDRKKNMIITGGVNVYAAEVEREMAGIAGVAEVLVFGRPDRNWGERVVAAIHGPSPLDPAALLEQGKQLLGSYKAPKEVIFSRTPLPRTTTGKIARSEIDALYASLASEPRAVSGDAG